MSVVHLGSLDNTTTIYSEIMTEQHVCADLCVLSIMFVLCYHVCVLGPKQCPLCLDCDILSVFSPPNSSNHSVESIYGDAETAFGVDTPVYPRRLLRGVAVIYGI